MESFVSGSLTTMSFSQSDEPDERLTPDSTVFTDLRNEASFKSSLVSADLPPFSAVRNAMYADAPEFDCVADVIANDSFLAFTASIMSFVDTGFVVPSVFAQPSSSALLCFTPNTTGVVDVETWSLTTCLISPMVIHMLLAGQTAS